jgi:hypothetical protein
MGIVIASRCLGTTIELIAPPNDSDKRSDAVSVGKGGSVSSTGGAMGEDFGCVVGVDVTVRFFVGGGTGFEPGAVVGNEIRVTPIARNGCSLLEGMRKSIDITMTRT